MKEGFRILRLKLVNHAVFGNNEFSFSEESEMGTNLYHTVIIGPNGTGKSVLLRIILDILRGLCIDVHSEKGFKPNLLFSISFASKGQEYQYTNLKEEGSSILQLVKAGERRYPSPNLFDANKELITIIAKEILPHKVIAQSIMLTDKFIVPRNESDVNEFPIYKYLGLRNRPQQASTRSYVRRTVELIVEQMNSDHFQQGLKKMTAFLDLTDDIVVVFETAYTARFFKGNLTFEMLDDYFLQIDKQYKEQENKIPPFKVGNYFALKKRQRIGELVDFINSLVHEQRLEHIYRSSVKKLNYHITGSSDHARLQQDFYFLDDLRKLGLLKVPDVKLSKKGINLQSVSSGEFHFFSTMVGLLATAEKNSLILMDEPEISLHPNWQMKYMNFINEAFSGDQYSGSQFLIATHSHFLISDLRSEQSFILGLKKTQGKVQTVEMNDDTFGWSAEEVLYKIFDVRTTRNYFLEKDLREILHLIANNSDDYSRIKILLENLEPVKLSVDDPLILVINRVKRYLNDK